MGLSSRLQKAVRTSTTRSLGLLRAKSLLNALVFFAVFLAALPWLAHRLLPTPLPIPGALGALAGGALFVLGIAGWLLCLESFSREGEGTPYPRAAPRKLVTTGLFEVVRNPIMLAELAVLWGEVLWVGSAGISIYALLITLGAHLLVVHVEEPELRRRFGEPYDAYCRRVPRWLPRLSRRRTRPEP